MPSDETSHKKRRTKKWLIVTGVTLGLLLIGVAAFVTWSTVAEGRRKERAEDSVHTALKQWCSDEPLDPVRDTTAGDYFDEFTARTSSAPRPTGYQVTGVSRVKDRTYHVAATLTFAGGPETRLYEVEVSKKSDKCFIKTAASEDVSGTESHARSVLQSWLDSWAAGEDMATFKRKHPEAAAKMTVDTTWASLTSAGKKLVRYDITTAAPAPGSGYRFTVTAVLEERGTPETKILRYTVSKNRALSGGRWAITGN